MDNKPTLKIVSFYFSLKAYYGCAAQVGYRQNEVSLIPWRVGLQRHYLNPVIFQIPKRSKW